MIVCYTSMVGAGIMRSGYILDIMHNSGYIRYTQQDLPMGWMRGIKTKAEDNTISEDAIIP